MMQTKQLNWHDILIERERRRIRNEGTKEERAKLEASKRKMKHEMLSAYKSKTKKTNLE